MTEPTGPLVSEIRKAWRDEAETLLRDGPQIRLTDAQVAHRRVLDLLDALDEFGAHALREAATSLRDFDRSGYLFLDGSLERVPWESVARWLDSRATDFLDQHVHRPGSPVKEARP